ASQDLNERHLLSHSFSVLRGRMHARPEVEREHMPAVLIRPQTNRPRLDRPDGNHIRTVEERYSGKALQCVIDRLRPRQRWPRVCSAAHKHLEFARVKRVT